MVWHDPIQSMGKHEEITPAWPTCGSFCLVMDDFNSFFSFYFCIGNLNCWGFRTEILIIRCCVEIAPAKDYWCIDWGLLVFQRIACAGMCRFGTSCVTFR